MTYICEYFAWVSQSVSLHDYISYVGIIQNVLDACNQVVPAYT